MTTLSTSGVRVGLKFLNNIVKHRLFDGYNYLEAMHQLHRESDPGQIQQRLLVPLIVRKEKVAVNEAE